MTGPALARRLRVLRLGSWRGRLRGLSHRGPPRPGVGVWLAPCDAIHTCGMRFDIDVFFLDHAGRVLRVVAALRPWRIALCPRAASAVEFEAGVVEAGPCGRRHVEAAVAASLHRRRPESRGGARPLC